MQFKGAEHLTPFHHIWNFIYEFIETRLIFFSFFFVSLLFSQQSTFVSGALCTPQHLPSPALGQGAGVHPLSAVPWAEICQEQSLTPLFP